MHRLFLLLSVLLVVFSQENEHGFFWVITDTHIDPSYKIGADPDNCNGEILCCRYFHANQTNRAPQFGSYTRCDQPPSALQQHLNWVRDFSNSMSVKPDFVLYGGDDSPHDNDVQTRETNMGASRQVYQMLSQTLRPMKVYSTIGNHECFPVDQLEEVPRGSWLMDFFTSLWTGTLPEESLRTVKKGGYYSVSLTKGLKLITLNTNWMDIINFYIYQNETKDYADQFNWFEGQLAEAEKNGEKVFVFAHIPSGYPGYLDGFTTYVPNKQEKYVSIMKKYHKVIVASYHGHKHTDYFQLVMEGGQALQVSLMGSAMTPWQNRNPGARLYKYDKKTFDLLDYTEYYSNLGEANRIGKVEWQKSYSFLEEYGMKDLKPSSFLELINKFKMDQPLFQKWYNNKGSKFSNHPCTGTCKKNWLCMMTSMDIHTYTTCKQSMDRN
jgi:sphingomyelin phosphodiesterase